MQEGERGNSNGVATTLAQFFLRVPFLYFDRLHFLFATTHNVSFSYCDVVVSFSFEKRFGFQV